MKKHTLTVRVALFLANVSLGVGLTFLFLLFWVKEYPEKYDPKNIDYVLWDHGLNRNMDLDAATSAMTHDVAFDRVRGLTKHQLADKFGTLKSVSEARPYDQYCYQEASRQVKRYAAAPNTEVVFLRESDWMVLLTNGKVVKISLCKGL